MAVKKVIGVANIASEFASIDKIPQVAGVLRPYDRYQFVRKQKTKAYIFMPILNMDGDQVGLAIVALRRSGDIALANQIVRRLAKQFFTTLAGMHARSAFHMDVKPANMMINKAGDVFVTDFGCLTTTNSFSGTNGDMAFFSPERLALYGHVASGGAFVDGDLEVSEAFSAGLAILEIAIGRYPFLGVTAATRLNVCTNAFFKQQVDIALAELDDGVLRNVLKDLLVVDPKARLSLRKLIGNGSLRSAEFDFASDDDKTMAFEKLLQQ